MTVTSIVTPVPSKANGAAQTHNASMTRAKAPTSKAVLKATTVTPKLTIAQARDIAFEYGQTMAGQDGALTRAFLTFKDNETAMADIVQALSEGYMVRKLEYTREKAREVIGLSKYNHLHPAKNTDKNRTFEQERVMGSIRTLVHRAKANAGLVEKATPAAKPEAKPATPAAKPATSGPGEHPDGNAIVSSEDVNVTMTRFLQTIQAYYKKHAADFADDAGMAWRDWIAQAPRVIIAK